MIIMPRSVFTHGSSLKFRCYRDSWLRLVTQCRRGGHGPEPPSKSRSRHESRCPPSGARPGSRLSARESPSPRHGCRAAAAAGPRPRAQPEAAAKAAGPASLRSVSLVPVSRLPAQGPGKPECQADRPRPGGPGRPGSSIRVMSHESRSSDSGHVSGSLSRSPLARQGGCRGRRTDGHGPVTSRAGDSDS